MSEAAQSTDCQAKRYVDRSVEGYIFRNDTIRKTFEFRPGLQPIVILGGVSAIFFAGCYFNKTRRILGTIGTVVPLSFLSVPYGLRYYLRRRGGEIFVEKMNAQMKEMAAQTMWPPPALNSIKQSDPQMDKRLQQLQSLIPEDEPSLPQEMFKNLWGVVEKKESEQLRDQLIGQTCAWAATFLEAKEKGAQDYAAEQLHIGLQFLNDPKLKKVQLLPTQ